MADWSTPDITSLKVDVLTLLKTRDVDAITLAESPTNPPTGAKRWVSASSKFQTWNGSSWVDLVLSLAGGGTGGNDASSARTALGIGTMGTQNSNAVSISGGAISGLSSIGSAGNATFAGLLTLGSTPTTVSDSAGKILESAIADANILTRVAANEVVTGTWSFGNGTASATNYFNGGTANSKGIIFVNNGSFIGQILSVNSVVYHDHDTQVFRDTAGTAIFATLNTLGLTIGTARQILADPGAGSVPSYAFNGDENTGMYNASTDGLGFIAGGATALEMINSGGNVTWNMGASKIGSTLMPSIDATIDLGRSDKRWKDVWASNGTIQTSDIRHKRNHGDIENALDIILHTETFIASWIQGPENLRFPALSAQNIKEIVDDELGTEVVKVDKFDSYAMYYERMIPILCAAIKELDAKVRRN